MLALITGASRGIGYEFAKVFAENNYNLILTARSANNLERIKHELENKFGIAVIIISKDLSDINQVKLLCKELDESSAEIDVLVNNTGVGLYGRHSETTAERELSMIELNITALTYLTKHFLQGMLKRRKGHILNVASTAAFKPGPMMAVYYATKSYVLTYSESLAAELKGTGVSVTALCPGPTKTDFFEIATNGKVKDMKFKKYMSARDAALYGYDAMLKKKLIAVPGFTNKLINAVIKFIPRSILGRVLFDFKTK
ncbi:MAG: SDR family oxidoreductase [Candidatus Kapaibacterium sp.]